MNIEKEQRLYHADVAFFSVITCNFKKNMPSSIQKTCRYQHVFIDE